MNDEQPVAETRPSSSSSVSSNSSSTMLESAAKVDRPLNEYLFPSLSSNSPSQHSRLLSNSTVDIWVGPAPDTTHYNIHEKLLCHHSPFFRRVFYGDKSESKKSKVFGLEEEDDATFEMFVGWLYSRSLRAPTQESEVGPLLDLYLMAVKFEIEALETDVVEAIRTFYYNNNSYPGLRRVQYIYSNTDDDNAMREMMVSSVARYLTLADKIPAHWENALKKNGQLAVDIIRSIQEWHLDNRSVPDARDASADRGRAGKFADVQSLPEGESFDSGNDLKFNGEAEE
jgi:hypothetical protein